MEKRMAHKEAARKVAGEETEQIIAGIQEKRGKRILQVGEAPIQHKTPTFSIKYNIKNNIQIILIRTASSTPSK